METLYSIGFLDQAPSSIGPLYSVGAETSSINRIHRFVIQNRAEFN
jgi:hypothetical protein